MTAPGQFEDPAQVDAARVIIAAATASTMGYSRTAALEPWTHPTGRIVLGDRVLTAVDVAAAGATILERLIEDVSHLVAISPQQTLARTGEWVARRER